MWGYLFSDTGGWDPNDWRRVRGPAQKIMYILLHATTRDVSHRNATYSVVLHDTYIDTPITGVRDVANCALCDVPILLSMAVLVL